MVLNFAAGERPRARPRGQAGGQGQPRRGDAARQRPRNPHPRRKAGEAEAAVDPLTDPAVRDAVAKATFEHLVGFQLSDEQLRYNATR